MSLSHPFMHYISLEDNTRSNELGGNESGTENPSKHDSK